MIRTDDDLAADVKNALYVLDIESLPEILLRGQRPEVHVVYDRQLDRIAVHLDWIFGDVQSKFEAFTTNFGSSARELIRLSPRELDGTLMRRFGAAMQRVSRVFNPNEMPTYHDECYRG